MPPVIGKSVNQGLDAGDGQLISYMEDGRQQTRKAKVLQFKYSGS
jgi:hypothetical protein